jgi:hypothetical protein
MKLNPVPFVRDISYGKIQSARKGKHLQREAKAKEN